MPTYEGLNSFLFLKTFSFGKYPTTEEKPLKFDCYVYNLPLQSEDAVTETRKDSVLSTLWLPFFFSEWHMGSFKVPDTRCDWVFNSTEGSATSPDNFLPPMTTCTYTFPVKAGHYLEVILTIYGLE